jgi:hypothetical protein
LCVVAAVAEAKAKPTNAADIASDKSQLPLQVCGESPVLKGHDFSRAENARLDTMGFSP